jgi:MFS family permease
MTRIDARRTGTALVAGALSWLAGVALLVAGVGLDSVASVWPRAMFGLAGVLIGVGALAGLRPLLPSRTARVGAAISGVTLLLAGLGLMIGTFVGFIVAYSSVQFLHPVGLLVLGIGLILCGGLPRWAHGVPPAMLGAAALTYGLHTFIPEAWDPPGALLFVVVGVGWLLLGAATVRSARVPTEAGPCPAS